MKYSYQWSIQNKIYNYHRTSSKMKFHRWGRLQEGRPFDNIQNLNKSHSGKQCTSFGLSLSIYNMKYRRPDNLGLKQSIQLLGKR